jgi:hypothetical protein
MCTQMQNVVLLVILTSSYAVFWLVNLTVYAVILLVILRFCVVMTHRMTLIIMMSH